MHKRQEIQQKSRLGLLLVNKGLISRDQLDEALRLQNKTGMRLGEVLIDQGWISEKQLNKSLKNQTRYRYAAAIAAMLLGPIQPFMASASMDKDPISASQMVESSPSERIKGLQALSDDDLGDVTAQGAMQNYNKLLDIVSGSVDINAPDGEEIKTLTGLLSPVSELLDADVEISDVTYAEGPKTVVNADGSIGLQLPTHIGEIAFKNVRVKGATGGHMGDLHIRDIDLSAVSATIRVHN